MILLERLQLRAGDFLLGPIDLEVPAGGYCVLLGPSGHGKTVLLDAVAGLRAPREGRVWLDGRDRTAAPPERRQIGYVMQRGALFPHLSARDNIAFGLRVRGVGRAERRRRAAELAKLLGVQGRLETRAAALSGGERQRVAIARALATAPRVLLLDEPLAALDPAAAAELRSVLRRVHAELGTTTLHVTHDFEEAAALGEQVGVLLGGRLAQCGPPEEVFRRPASEAVARFMGVHNVFTGALEPHPEGGAVLRGPGGLCLRVATERTGPARVSIAPDEVVLARAPFTSSAANVLAGTVQRIEPRGPLCTVTIELGGERALVALVLARSARELGLAPGVAVHAAFKASAVHVIAR